MATKKDNVTRTREGGRRNFVTTTGAERVAACRTIVAEKSFAKIDGVTVDLFSASAVVAVYDALKEERSRTMFESFDIGKMARVSFKLLK